MNCTGIDHTDHVDGCVCFWSGVGVVLEKPPLLLKNKKKKHPVSCILHFFLRLRPVRHSRRSIGPCGRKYMDHVVGNVMTVWSSDEYLDGRFNLVYSHKVCPRIYTSSSILVINLRS